MSFDDQRFMAQAIRLGALGRYTTHPNPCVGCVIVQRGQVVGEGYHVLAGEGHAEANALAQAGEASKGSTVYVTLEPCSFHGRTPSCAEALIKADVARVVVACEDPDGRNAGRGLTKMKDAGIVVDLLPSASADRLIEGHRKRYLEDKPFVRLKLAMTLDGKIALGNGESRWITSPESRADVQKLRAESAAIVTGAQTVIDDDPSLRVRAEMPGVKHRAEAIALDRPIYILDSTLRVPEHVRLLKDANTIQVCLQGSVSADRPGNYLEMPADQGRICLESFVRTLADRGHSVVLFECGATLAGAMLNSKLVDELIIYVAPRLIGTAGRSLLNLPEIDRMSDVLDLSLNDVRLIGPDIRISASRAQVR